MRSLLNPMVVSSCGPGAPTPVFHSGTPTRGLRAARLQLLCFLATTLFAAESKAPRASDQASAIPTFHCISLYWSPAGGALENAVLVQYRVQGTSAWSEGLPMRYNPIPGTDEDLADYRGSIVNLTPGTSYEIELTLAGMKTKTHLTSATWSETFPIGDTVKIASGDQPLAITQSGTPKAYRVYDGRGATIDVHHKHDACITIDASYIILRGVTLRGGGDANRKTRAYAHAITINGGENIVIEDCDVA